MEFVLNLFKLSICLEVGKDAIVSLMNVFLHQSNRYPIVPVIARALRKVSAWIGVGKSQGLNPLVLSCIENGPKGWSQNVSVSCTCQDCQLLQTFLTSST